MKRHTKKMIAPIVIAAVMVLYYLGFSAACFLTDDIPRIAKWLGGLIPLALSAVCIYVLAERIKEIKGGEEDDLSQY